MFLPLPGSRWKWDGTPDSMVRLLRNPLPVPRGVIHDSHLMLLLRPHSCDQGKGGDAISGKTLQFALMIDTSSSAQTGTEQTTESCVSARPDPTGPDCGSSSHALPVWDCLLRIKGYLSSAGWQRQRGRDRCWLDCACNCGCLSIETAGSYDVRGHPDIHNCRAAWRDWRMTLISLVGPSGWGCTPPPFSRVGAHVCCLPGARPGSGHNERRVFLHGITRRYKTRQTEDMKAYAVAVQISPRHQGRSVLPVLMWPCVGTAIELQPRGWEDEEGSEESAPRAMNRRSPLIRLATRAHRVWKGRRYAHYAIRTVTPKTKRYSKFALNISWFLLYFTV
jgi:hypothetical protein